MSTKHRARVLGIGMSGVLVMGLAIAPAVTVGVGPAAAAPTGSQYLVWSFDVASNTFAGAAAYGRAGQEVLVGDWDGDGKDGFAVRNGNVYSFRNSPTSGNAEFTVRLGYPGDRVLVGDWDGNGTDTIATRSGTRFLWINSLRTGAPTRQLNWGVSSDKPIAGDWNGDRKHSFGLRRGTTYYFINTMTSTRIDYHATVGRSTDEAIVGDWNGDKRSTLALRRGNQYSFYTTIGATDRPTVRTWGASSGRVFAGNWTGRIADGRRIDSLGAVRGNDAKIDVWLLTNAQRARYGLRPVKYSQCQEVRYAQPVTVENAQHGRLQHQQLARGLCTPDAYGENIAAGYNSPTAVMSGWMNSSGHRANILNPRWTVMASGYTVSGSSYRYWWSQNFG